jgi:outer membrane protein TolC
LTALHNDANELHARDDAARHAQANLDIARAQYSAGGVSQFSLLDTQRQALQSALDQTQAQAARLSDTAALFQSLGSSQNDSR